MKPKASKRLSLTWVSLLCISCFFLGVTFTSRFRGSDSGSQLIFKHRRDQEVNVLTDDYGHEKEKSHEKGLTEEVLKTHKEIESLGKSVAMLQKQLSVRHGYQQVMDVSPTNTSTGGNQTTKVFMVIGINTAFSSRQRRDSLRETWMPQGEKLEKLEKEKGIVVKFMIGHSATPHSIPDKEIDSEDAKYRDFFRLDHVEGYHNLSAKTKTFFSSAVATWDAEFYVKIDDDVHVNLGMLASTLALHRHKPRVYIGCMKSGPVLSKKTAKYHEPEFWKFGEEGNKYFRHATGQIYAISKDLATYISNNQAILHKYANEDVTLGSWFIGLEIEHIDDGNFCCSTPDCQLKAEAGEVCVASFDWRCSGHPWNTSLETKVTMFAFSASNEVMDVPSISGRWTGRREQSLDSSMVVDNQLLLFHGCMVKL
ncbi:beta-1,3-galactosyltransferase 5 [Hirschfeldia incana]|nr:beta-1,3-galactosyltransferase 5 [Hirschfeldia incana]